MDGKELQLKTHRTDIAKNEWAEKARRSISYKMIEIIQTYKDENKESISQENLAEVLGVSPRTISRWINGGAKIQACDLFWLAHETNIPIMAFFPDYQETIEKKVERGDEEKLIYLLEELLQKLKER